MKTCRRCNVEQPFSEFQPDVRYKDNHRNWCKACYREYAQGRRFLLRMQERQGRYGITIDEQVEMMAAQDRLCAACADPISHETAHVDHDHATGRVRGFLCMPCNLTVGSSLESPERLMACAAYLIQQEVKVS